MTANCRPRAKGHNLRVIMCFVAVGATEATSDQIVECSASCSFASASPRRGKRWKDRGIGSCRTVRRPVVNLFPRPSAGRAATPDSGRLSAKPVSDPIGEYATGVSRFGEQIVIDSQASTRGAVFQEVLVLDAVRGCLEQAGLPWILKFNCC